MLQRGNGTTEGQDQLENRGRQDGGNPPPKKKRGFDLGGGGAIRRLQKNLRRGTEVDKKKKGIPSDLMDPATRGHKANWEKKENNLTRKSPRSSSMKKKHRQEKKEPRGPRAPREASRGREKETTKTEARRCWLNRGKTLLDSTFPRTFLRISLQLIKKENANRKKGSFRKKGSLH